MIQFGSLFANYDRLVIFDTETTGLKYAQDEIIEFAAVVLEVQNGMAQVTRQYDELITLSPGKVVPPEIEKLTGISNQDIQARGIPKSRLCSDIAELIGGKTLLLAYNAQFDLCFLYYLLANHGDPSILQGKDKLDLFTVYRDRHSFPQKLCNAIETYGLQDTVVNSHRAIDDVIATVAVMGAMEAERQDLEKYVNLFGYNPKFGAPKPAIRSITYRPQGPEPNPNFPLYR